MEKKLLKEQSAAELGALLQETKAAYDAFQAKKLSLNMARGKPGPEQLDLTMPMLNALSADSGMISESGDDTRNYGVLAGISEAKKIFADILGAQPDEMFVGGNSSLELMFACLQLAYVQGIRRPMPSRSSTLVHAIASLTIAWSRSDRIPLLPV